MKKIKYLLILLVVFCAALVGCDSKGYVEVDYKELQNKIEKKETFVLFIGRETCSACSIYKDVLNERKNDHKGIIIYYIDLDKLTDEERNKIDATYSYTGTPTSFIIEKGQQPTTFDSFTGYNVFDRLLEKLKEKGIIK